MMKNYKNIFKVFIIILLIFIPIVANISCRITNISKQERKIEREKKRRQKEDAVLYQRALQRHIKMQSDDTRQEMRENLRRAEKYNRRQKEFFLKRWFDSLVNRLSKTRKQKG